MTSQGSPYARFQRALRIGRLPIVRAAAAELQGIDRDEALAICLLIEDQDADHYERAAVRWLARLSLEASQHEARSTHPEAELRLIARA